MADLTDHVIHNQDGTPSERNFYATTRNTDPALMTPNLLGLTAKVRRRSA